MAPPRDFGAVAVVDGTAIKVTPFKMANIPPPMAMYEVTAGSSVVDIAFSQDNSFMVVLHHGGLNAYSWQAKETRSLPPALLSKLEFDTPESTRYETPAMQLCLSGQNTVHVLHRGEDLAVTTYDLDLSGGKISLMASHGVKPGSSLVASNTGTTAYTQDHHGQLFPIGEVDSGGAHAKFPTQVPWAEVITHDNKSLAFGLSRSGHLYADARLLLRNCTTFLVTPEHLILTTSNHLLKFIHLDDVDGESCYS